MTTDHCKWRNVNEMICWKHDINVGLIIIIIIIIIIKLLLFWCYLGGLEVSHFHTSWPIY
jgi:hypothetical protein